MVLHNRSPTLDGFVMNERLNQLRTALVHYALAPLNLAKLTPEDEMILAPLIAALPKGPTTGKSLEQILTALDTKATPAGLEQPAAPLSDLADYIHRRASHPPSPILPDEHPDAGFETWVSTVQRLTFTLPARSGERGVSLYHEFKLLSAMGHAAIQNQGGMEDGFLLVSGDFPGVQRTIYTIGSDGATKGVRGRSLFLQLLADCVVRRILQDLDLPVTNAIYIAGGNFLLLAPAGAAERVEAITIEINHNLLSVFYGDLSLVTATEAIPASAIAKHDAIGKHITALKQLEGKRKSQPFAEVALSHGTSEEPPAVWHNVFKPYGGGGQYYCAVSQREPMTTAELAAAQAAVEAGEAWVAPEQRAFQKLAEDLVTARYLVYSISSRDTLPEDDLSYDHLLAWITGWSCVLVEERPRSKASGIVLELNRLEFDPARAHGFRMLAVHTPRVTRDDIEWWEEHYKGKPFDPSEGRPHVGSIRTFDMLAFQSREVGFARLGVLRMDVDSLGAVFKERINPMTLTRRMAVSDTLSMFFDGYLAQICRDVEGSERPNSLYLIYGGGDDLFIVGEWDLMPKLAERIRNEFSAYTNGQLTISAGVSLVPVHFPFYRAAEVAKAALDDQAKEYRRVNGQPKDAICFLHEVFPWKPSEAWQQLRCEQERLLALSEKIHSNTISQNVYRIYSRWVEDRRERPAGDKYIFYGPYKWLAAYQLTRLANQYSEIKPDIEAIQKSMLDNNNITLMGVAARWAQLERRIQFTEGSD